MGVTVILQEGKRSIDVEEHSEVLRSIENKRPSLIRQQSILSNLLINL